MFAHFFNGLATIKDTCNKYNQWRNYCISCKCDEPTFKPNKFFHNTKLLIYTKYNVFTDQRIVIN